jgi:hypothetical protein
LVKASYFPNWHASGAKGPWRVTPNLMVVIPTSNDVSLHYGYTPVDGLGWLCTLLGIVGLVWLVRRGTVELPDREPWTDDEHDVDEPLPDPYVHLERELAEVMAPAETLSYYDAP